jgi:anti-sigma-K factor RskA
MIDDDDIDGIAAEFVLGSLDPSERKAVDERGRKEPALARAIAAWERRLAPLAARGAEVEPPAHLFAGIMSRIAALDGQGTASAGAISLRRSRGRWRAGATVTAALAACLAFAVGWFLYLQTDEPTALVAELHRSTGNTTADEIVRPAFVVTVDLKTCKISVRPVTARPRPGRSYELWVIRQGAATPTRLTLVSQSETTTASCPTGYTSSDLTNAMLAVSLEPEGGSPIGEPSSGFMFVGKLMPAREMPK